MAKQIIIILVSAFSFSAVQAASQKACPADDAMNMLIYLDELSDKLDQPPKIERHVLDSLVKFNDMQDHPIADISKTVDLKVSAVTQDALSEFKKAVTLVRADIDSGLTKGANHDANLIKMGLNSLVDKIDPSRLPEDESIENMRDVVAVNLAAAPTFKAAHQEIRDLMETLDTRCLTPISFHANVGGEFYTFTKCNEGTMTDPNAAAWGGALPVGSCRHIANCEAVTTIDGKLVPSVDWVFDCKKQSGECLDIPACAAQKAADGGQIRKAQDAETSK